MTHTASKAILVVIAILTLHQAGYSQGTFANLDFENPTLPLSPGIVPFTSALPGWAGYSGGSSLDWAFYNDESLGAASASLQGPGSVYQPYEGSYFVFLQASFPGGLIIPAIAQAGVVPTSAQSVRFFASAPFYVFFAGQQIPLSLLGQTSAYSNYGADISAFAGQTGELRFQGGGFLDNIFFSNLPVPEPSVFGLSAVGALLLGWCVRRRL